MAPELLPPQKSPGPGKKGEQAQKGKGPAPRARAQRRKQNGALQKECAMQASKNAFMSKQLEQNSSQQDKAGTLLSQAS